MDGLVPWPTFLVAVRAMTAHRAADALQLVRAQLAIHSDEAGRRKQHEQLDNDAEPGP